ncbi:YoaK family protein [Filimonas lacunae]|nr:YoaK family protein [Filimonas lacunae]
MLLCLTAGFVNASGFLGFMVLTTNVTGHAALLAVKLTEGDLRSVRMIGLWLILFLAGAFLSSLYISKAGHDNPYAYSIPVIVEIIILVLVGYFGYSFDNTIVKTEYFAGSLLFAMGMQNALVSIVSGSVVRTTHLTGMFTDLGIDLAAALLKPTSNYSFIWRKIELRIIIITFFLAGGIIGGFVFVKLRYHSFYLAAGFLVIAMFYDFFRVKVKRIQSKVRKMTIVRD